MIATLTLIFKIAGILMDAAPSLYKYFMEIMAAIKPTAEAGNADSAAVAKSTAKAIIPVLDAETAQKVQAAIDEHDATIKGAPDGLYSNGG